jgi:hypothetical protein
MATAKKAAVTADEKKMTVEDITKKGTIEAKVAEIMPFCEQAERTAIALMVTNDAELAEANAHLGTIKAAGKRVSEWNGMFCNPLKELVKSYNSLFSKPADALASAETKVKSKIAAYYREQDEKAKKEEARLAKLKEKRDERAVAAGKQVEYTPAPVVARPATFVKSEGGAATTAAKVWKFEITDIHALPDAVKRQILEKALERGVADTIVRAHMNAGTRELAGVRFYEDYQISATAA